MAEPKSAERMRRWPIIIALIFGAIVLAVTLLPTILSTQWGRQQVLNRAASYIPGEIMVDNWSLSWFNDQTLAGISYDNPQSGVIVDAAALSIDKGLSSLLFDRGNLGTIRLSQPAVQIRLPEPAPKDGGASTPSQTGSAQSPGPAAPGSAGAKNNEAAGSGLPPISGRLVVQQGSVDVIRSGSTPENVAKNIDLEIDVSSAADPLTYAIASVSPDGTGTISGTGKIQLELSGTALDSVQPSGKLMVSSWPIAQLLDLAALYAPLPTGSGVLDSTIDFDGELNQGIKVNGSVDLSKLSVSGGPLNEDNLSVDKTSIEFSAVGRTGSLELSSLTLKSPLASGKLAATVSDSRAVQFDSDLSINLPEVASQLPRTLNLQEGLQITGGILALQAKASLSQEEKQFTANASVEGLAGVHEGKQIALDEPFTFNLIGQQGSGGLRLDKLVVDSSFLNGSGQGDLNDLGLAIKADIGAALREISKFVSLQDYKATGQIDLSLTARRHNEQTVDLAVRLSADKLVLKQGKTTIIPQSPLQIKADSKLALSPDFIFSGMSGTSLDYQTWLGTGTLSAQEISLDDDRKLQSIGNLVVDTQLSFGDLGIMLKSLGLLPGKMNLDGIGSLQLKLSGSDKRFAIESANLDSPKISLSRGSAQLIPASALKLDGNAEILLSGDGSIAALDKPDMAYETWLGNGTLKADSFNIPDKRIKAMSYQGNTDLEKLSTLLSALELMPPELSFSGSETSALTMDYSIERIDLASLHTEIDNFVLKQQEKTYRDKRLVIDTAGSIVMDKRQASFQPLNLNSANGTVSLEQLAVGDWNNLLDTFDSSGQARFELSNILTSAADWVSLPDNVSASAAIDLDWKTDAHSSAEHRYQLKADLGSVNLTKNEMLVFNNEQVDLSLNGARNPDTGHLSLEQLTLASSPLNFAANGDWNSSSTGDTDLAFQGTLAMDLARLAELVRTITEFDIEMAGKSERPFQLSSTFSPEQRQKWYQHTTFDTAFQADLIKVLGVEIRSLEVPVNLADGIGQAQIKGSANEGALLLQPRIDLTSNPPLVSIPEKSRVLDKMKITKDMATQLLARIHPLFMDASEMSGEFDLDLDSFSWPLGKEHLNDIKFAGVMEFYDVRVGTSALIGALLEALNAEEKGLDLDERQIEFVCQDGRVITNPLKTRLGDSELTISGSLGLDTTIDYLARVPVTKQIVGGDLYEYLEGTMINVPIGGTLSDPDISAQTIERAIADLARQAGQKQLEKAAGDLLKRLF